ncbi:MAG: 50S ribosomal protein L11 methyltransferase [Spirochaetes bacterium]|nr:50S ribosomal protein L11 methyltransferase [Spirochaetota bacterium]
MNELDEIIQTILPAAQTIQTALPLCRQLKLYLLDQTGLDRTFSNNEMQAIFTNTPFWAFCWASGYALASYILSNPSKVCGRRIIDFGSGSGIVAIAAAMAGADEAAACDIDINALKAAKINADLNNVRITTCKSVEDNVQKYDLLTAADVLYNTNNLFLLDRFFNYAPEVLLAESRVKNIGHPSYNKIYEGRAATLPRLDKSDIDEHVSIYTGNSCLCYY